MSSRAVLSPLAITGYGAVNALGSDAGSFWREMVRGRSAVRYLEGARASWSESPAGVVVESSEADGAGSVAPSRAVRFALSAAAQAFSQSMAHDDHPPHRIGVVVGTTTGGLPETEGYVASRRRGRPASASRLLALDKSRIAGAIASRFGCRGPRFTVNTACASGASAILAGAQMVTSGVVDAVIAGGSDALAQMVFAGFRSLRVLAASGCRPFAKERDGISLGEGAAMVVIERESVAVARGVRVVARLLSGGQTTDAWHLTAPDPQGIQAARAIRLALEAAGLGASDVGFVVAHGTGTHLNDASEAAALRAALGDHAARCPVTSIKGAIGHTLGAAGAMNVVAAIAALSEGLVPPTAGLAEPDAGLGLNLVADRPVGTPVGVALALAFGFGGVNAAVCLGRGDA